jgi:hypothetical protein
MKTRTHRLIVTLVVGITAAGILAGGALAEATPDVAERAAGVGTSTTGTKSTVAAAPDWVERAAQRRSGSFTLAGHRNERGGLELTYTKWMAPSFPNMVGVVGGDIVGQFGGAVLQATPDATGRFMRLRAIYIVVAPDPSRSLIIRVNGAQDNQAGTAVLDGRVVDGPLTGARAHAEYKVIKSCSQSPDQMCFQGTIRIKQRAVG